MKYVSVRIADRGAVSLSLSFCAILSQKIMHLAEEHFERGPTIQQSQS